MRGKVMWLGLVMWVLAVLVGACLVGTVLVFADNGNGGGNTWGVIGAFLVPLLGVLSALCGWRWVKAIKALKEGSEAIVALGMCGLKLADLLEKPGTSTAQKVEEVLAQVRVVAKEFREAIDAATRLFRRTKRYYQ